MYPILTRRAPLALYIGVWVLVAGLLGALLAGQTALGWSQASLIALPLALVYAFVCLSAWYVSRGMPLAATSAPRVLATAVATAVLSSAGWLLVARQWLRTLLARGWLESDAGTLDAIDSLFFGIGVLLYLLSLAVSYLLGTFEERRDVERKALQAQVLSREAELRSLRAQIDPHFLFNSLQSISALTTADPAAARRMCLLLADFLRESLAVGSEDRITLGRELKLVERFVDVERVRFGNRLQASISGGDAQNCVVPPLLLLPLVENAVTHGIAHLLDGGTIRVQVTRRGQRVAIVVENPCDRDRPRGRRGGVGLANVRARLQAMHGTDAQFTAGEQAGLWRAELTLPATEAHERT
jgi:hypothetical protein